MVLDRVQLHYQGQGKVPITVRWWPIEMNHTSWDLTENKTVATDLGTTTCSCAPRPERKVSFWVKGAIDWLTSPGITVVDLSASTFGVVEAWMKLQSHYRFFGGKTDTCYLNQSLLRVAELWICWYDKSSMRIRIRFLRRMCRLQQMFWYVLLMLSGLDGWEVYGMPRAGCELRRTFLPTLGASFATILETLRCLRYRRCFRNQNDRYSDEVVSIQWTGTLCCL